MKTWYLILLVGGTLGAILLFKRVIPPQPKGTLVVNTTPIGGDIYVNDNWVGKGTHTKDYTPGIYTVSFGSVSGYTTPDPQEIEIIENQITEVTGTYVEEPTPPPPAAVAFLCYHENPAPLEMDWVQFLRNAGHTVDVRYHENFTEDELAGFRVMVTSPGLQINTQTIKNAHLRGTGLIEISERAKMGQDLGYLDVYLGASSQVVVRIAREHPITQGLEVGKMYQFHGSPDDGFRGNARDYQGLEICYFGSSWTEPVIIAKDDPKYVWIGTLPVQIAFVFVTEAGRTLVKNAVGWSLE